MFNIPFTSLVNPYLSLFKAYSGLYYSLLFFSFKTGFYRRQYMKVDYFFFFCEILRSLLLTEVTIGLNNTS